LTASPGALSGGGWGWANPIVPGGRSLLVCPVSTRRIVVANTVIIAIATIIEDIVNATCVRRWPRQLRSLLIDNASRLFVGAAGVGAAAGMQSRRVAT